MSQLRRTARAVTGAPWLTPRAPFCISALGVLLGLGVGFGALFGITGIAGIGLCLLVLAGAFVWAKDAEPVLVGLDVQAQPHIEPREPAPEPKPTPAETLDMVALPGGTFLMGSPESDSDAHPAEKPQHKVTVSAFLISRYPITRQLYRDIVGLVPSQWERNTNDQRLPANYVHWFEAVMFCNALSTHVGLSPCYRIDGEHVEWDCAADGYRLPTEAEWEYACRAGTTSKWFFGDDPADLDRYAWFAANSGRQVHPVGEKDPNPWGLHDMIGNVWEWCWDWYAEYPSHPTQTLNDPIGPEEGTSRVLRGGAWINDPRFLRSASRNGSEPENRIDDIGFRCVRRPRRQP